MRRIEGEKTMRRCSGCGQFVSKHRSAPEAMRRHRGFDRGCSRWGAPAWDVMRARGRYSKRRWATTPRRIGNAA